MVLLDSIPVIRVLALLLMVETRTLSFFKYMYIYSTLFVFITMNLCAHICDCTFARLLCSFVIFFDLMFVSFPSLACALIF